MSNQNQYFVRARYTAEGPEKSYPDYYETGILDFGKDCSISGRVIDASPQQNVSAVRGMVARIDKGDFQITLLKEGVSPEIRYFVRKSDGKDSIEGKYKGYWRHTNESESVKKTRARMVLMDLGLVSKVFPRVN